MCILVAQFAFYYWIVCIYNLLHPLFYGIYLFLWNVNYIIDSALYAICWSFTLWNICDFCIRPVRQRVAYIKQVVRVQFVYSLLQNKKCCSCVAPSTIGITQIKEFYGMWHVYAKAKFFQFIVHICSKCRQNEFFAVFAGNSCAFILYLFHKVGKTGTRFYKMVTVCVFAINSNLFHSILLFF